MATINYQPTLQPQFSVLFTLTGGGIFEQDPPPPPGTIYGPALAALTEGIVVAYRVAASTAIRTQKSTSLAVAAWRTVEAVTAAADDNCAPSLAVGLNDDLWIAWHNAAGAVSIQRHKNGWQAAVTTSPTLTGKHPRLLLTEDRQYIAYWSTAASAIKLYGSNDFFATLDLLGTFSVSEQVVSLFQDRSGLLHLLAESGGNVRQWTSSDGAQWTDRGTLQASRTKPQAGYTVAGGALFAWNTGNALQVWRLGGAHTETVAGPAAVTSAFPEQVAGVCVDRYDVVWLALQDSSGFNTDNVGRLMLDTEPPGPRKYPVSGSGGMGMF